MKIVKKYLENSFVFDTENLSFIEDYRGETRVLTPLHFTHDVIDYEFLTRFFPEDHLVLQHIGQSYYYALKKNTI